MARGDRPRRYGPAPVPLPVRGVPGGWRDPWDDPCPVAEARRHLAEVDRRQRAVLRREMAPAGGAGVGLIAERGPGPAS